MSFFASRIATVTGLRALQKNICDYGGLPVPCDCKYGVSFPQMLGAEQNGCPEVVSAIQLLEAMTEVEYEALMRRADGTLASTLLSEAPAKKAAPPASLLPPDDHHHVWIPAPLGWGCSVRMRNDEDCNRVAVIACDEAKHPDCFYGVCADHKHFFVKAKGKRT